MKNTNKKLVAALSFVCLTLSLSSQAQVKVRSIYDYQPRVTKDKETKKVSFKHYLINTTDTPIRCTYIINNTPIAEPKILQPSEEVLLASLPEKVKCNKIEA